MSAGQLSLVRAGKKGLLGDPVKRRLLDWIEDLAGCNQEELAGRAELSSRSLRNFAAGRGGPKTLAQLARAVRLPLWVVHETMVPVIAIVDLLWRSGAPRPGEEGAFLEARNRAVSHAARIAVVGFLARRAPDGSGGPIPPGQRRTWAGLHPADARVLIRWLQSLGGRTRRDLAARAGLSHEALRMYEAGEWPLEAPALHCLTEGAGIPLWLAEGLMLPAISAVRLVAEHPHGEGLLSGWECTLVEAAECALAQTSTPTVPTSPGLIPQVQDRLVSSAPKIAAA